MQQHGSRPLLSKWDCSTPCNRAASSASVIALSIAPKPGQNLAPVQRADGNLDVLLSVESVHERADLLTPLFFSARKKGEPAGRIQDDVTQFLLAAGFRMLLVEKFVENALEAHLGCLMMPAWMVSRAILAGHDPDSPSPADHRETSPGSRAELLRMEAEGRFCHFLPELPVFRGHVGTPIDLWQTWWAFCHNCPACLLPLRWCRGLGRYVVTTRLMPRTSLTMRLEMRLRTS